MLLRTLKIGVTRAADNGRARLPVFVVFPDPTATSRMPATLPTARPASVRVPTRAGAHSSSPRLAAALTAASLSALLAACGDPDGAAPPPIGDVVPSAAPIVADATTPSLTVDANGSVHLSVMARLDSARHALRFATWRESGWSAWRDITNARPFFVNWADFPSIVALENGDLAAHWLEREGEGTYAYGVRITRSRDGGATWEAPVTPHGDGLLAEHGFVSLWAAGGDRVGAVWLDGRKTAMADSAREMTVRATTIGRDERQPVETLLDARTCDCCQTASAPTRRGRVIVYRDRTDAEIRDIAIVREADGQWSEPARVHADEWFFEACPVNGPAVASMGDTVVVAWFTGAQDTARVRVATSVDGGVTFAPPVRIDDGDPIGRTSVVLDDAARPVVLWVERTSADSAAVRVRRLSADGAQSAAVTVATVSASRQSGFPRMVRSGNRLVFAWTEAGAGVRAATAPLLGSSR
jgi:hypothetical protein